MHGGAKDFEKNISVNAIKRFFAKKGMRMLWENY